MTNTFEELFGERLLCALCTQLLRELFKRPQIDLSRPTSDCVATFLLDIQDQRAPLHTTHRRQRLLPGAAGVGGGGHLVHAVHDRRHDRARRHEAPDHRLLGARLKDHVGGRACGWRGWPWVAWVAVHGPARVAVGGWRG